MFVKHYCHGSASKFFKINDFFHVFQGFSRPGLSRTKPSLPIPKNPKFGTTLILIVRFSKRPVLFTVNCKQSIETLFTVNCKQSIGTLFTVNCKQSIETLFAVNCKQSIRTLFAVAAPFVHHFDRGQLQIVFVSTMLTLSFKSEQFFCYPITEFF